MQIPIEITFRGVDKTDEMEQLILIKAEKLDRVCDHITSCRVVVERSQKHQSSGQPYRVRIAIKVPPGHELAITRDPSKGELHQDLGAEIRWAFDAAERQLIELTDRQHRDVKVHPHQQVQGVILRLIPQDNYGFIRTNDGREIFFHRNSVLHNEFDHLKIGTGVRFNEEMGEKGPQAATVQIVDSPESI